MNLPPTPKDWVVNLRSGQVDQSNQVFLRLLLNYARILFERRSPSLVILFESSQGRKLFIEIDVGLAQDVAQQPHEAISDVHVDEAMAIRL